MRKSLEAKNEEIQVKENEKLRIKIHFQTLLQEKYATIEMLTKSLHDSETKVIQLTRELLTGSSNETTLSLEFPNSYMAFP